MPTFRLLLTIAAWDGCLPLVMASGCATLSLLFPAQRGALAGAVMILCPILAALIRCHLAWWQLQQLGCGPTVRRQATFALAIVVLMVFEGLAAGLALDPNAPHVVWLIVAALFGVYLTLVYQALRPEPTFEMQNRAGRDWAV